MEFHWLVMLGCLCLMAAPGASGPITTQKTLVMARSDESTPETLTARSHDRFRRAATGPLLPVKLMKLDVVSEVSLRYARTVVVARVMNPANHSQETDFRVLLPKAAFISGFSMTVHKKCYKAYVKEKEEAKKIYNHAVNQGVGAGHVTAKARNSNQFLVSVNVEPLTSTTFNLTYEELLERRYGVYEHVINLHPGAIVPKLSVTVHIKEAQAITELRVPEIRTGNQITMDDAQNPQAVIRKSKDEREVTITFSPNVDEQKELMQVYLEKANHKGVLGQFVVQYDVERDQEGEILVNDGYFVHFFAPSSLPPLNKYVVFVLDTSGSMMDRKIIQLREAMQTILSDLNPGDYFSIVEFASSVTVHDIAEADQSGYVKKSGSALVAPFPARPDTIVKAKIITNRLEAEGGTNIYDALDTALKLTKNLRIWGQNLNPDEFEKIKGLDSMIIFLTDGQATEGNTDYSAIINNVITNNSGEDKAIIFSLAFGDDADSNFLRKLSLLNDGFMRHIYEAADAALQLHDFYRQVSSPLLADVKFVYPANQVIEGTLTKSQFRSYYGGSEIVVSGQLDPSAAALTPQVLAKGGSAKASFNKTLNAMVPTQKQLFPLERFWTYLTIKQLLDEKDTTVHANANNNGPAERALALALKYEFVTPISSMVVVKPDATNEVVDPVSVDDPSLAGASSYNVSLPTSVNAKPSSSAVPAAQSPFTKYGLQDFSWVDGLVNQSTNVLSLDVNGTRVDLKLAKGSVVPKTLGGDEACARAVDGGEGVCVYLTRCESAKYITRDIYAIISCNIYNGYSCMYGVPGTKGTPSYHRLH